MLRTETNSPLHPRSAQAIRSILVATDLSPSSRNALQFAIGIARRYEAQLHFVNVISSLGYTISGSDAMQQARGLARRDMDDLHTELVCLGALRGLRSRFSVRDGDIPAAIEHYADEEDVDLIVLGTHCRRGLSHLLMGSVAERIFRFTQRPVLTANTNTRPVLDIKGIDQVLFATDFGSGSTVGFSYAASIAAQFGATLSMLHVIPEGELQRKQARESESPIQTSVQHLRTLSDSRAGLETLHFVESGDVAESILRIARAGCANLIVMGLKRARHIAMAVRYRESIAHRVLRGSYCPLLTIRA